MSHRHLVVTPDAAPFDDPAWYPVAVSHARNAQAD